MPTILFIHLYNDRSGSPKVLLQAVNALHSAGYEVEVLTSKHEGGFLDQVPGKKNTIFYKRSEKKLLTLFYYLVSQVFLFFRCLAYIRKDVVFHVNTLMPFGAALAAWLMRKKVIYHIHETSIRPMALKKILRFFVSLTAAHVIYVSDYLFRVDSFKDKKITILRNSVDAIPNLKSKELHEDFNVLMLCSLKDYKGVNEFLQLAKNLDFPESKFIFSLVLNASQDEVDLYFGDKVLPSNIVISSRQFDVSSFYKKASLLLNLTRPDECVETYGLTIVEGMSYGLPVIVPPVGGPAEIVDNGIQGYLISCYEVDKIKECILLMFNDKQLYNFFSTNARKRSLDFSPGIFDSHIVNFYTQQVLR